MAGESGGAHVGPRLGSHPETSPRLGTNFTAFLGYMTVSAVPTV